MSEALIAEPGSLVHEPMPSAQRLVVAERPSEAALPKRRASRAVELLALPTVRPGQLWFVELPVSEPRLAPLEHRVLTSANVIIYDRALAGTVAGILPLGGYAEPALSIGGAADHVLERCLRFARDGWSVARLLDPQVKPDKSSERIQIDRIRQLSEQLLSRETLANLPVAIFVNEGGVIYKKSGIELGELRDILDFGGAEHPLALMIAFGAIDTEAIPRFSIVSANGLAG